MKTELEHMYPTIKNIVKTPEELFPDVSKDIPGDVYNNSGGVEAAEESSDGEAFHYARMNSADYESRLRRKYKKNTDKALSTLRTVKGNDPENPDYDIGGALWGGTVYAVYDPTEETEGVVYSLAKSPKDAILSILE